MIIIGIGANIRFLRTQHGYSQEDLSEKLGYKSYTTITKWESGVSEPTLKKANEIAAFFNISVNDLCYKDLTLPLSASERPTKAVSINVLGRVAAGIPLEAIEEIVDTEEITEDLARTGDFFGLRIKGDSMEPRICDGDVVIVRKQENADSGDIVIAMVNGDDAVCKRLIKYTHGIGLISLNAAKYEPMMYTPEEISKKPVRIIGKVVELRGKF